jgi:hypothetical protein
LVTLQAFLELGGVSDAVALKDLAARSRYIMRHNPRLAGDAREHLDDRDEDWCEYWRRWPVAAWTGELRGSSTAALFEVVDDRFRLRQPVFVGARSAAETMLAELVDYRLCRYLDLIGPRAGEWRLRVGQTEGRPIVWLDRPRNRDLPEGEVRISVDGRPYVGLFRKIALNKIHEASSSANALPEILRGWFGPDAGAAGSAHYVVIREDAAYWKLAPADRDVMES